MVLKRALIHVLLSLLVLLGQQAAWTHAATHLAKLPPSSDQQLPHGKVCDQCVFSAQIGTALVGKVFSFEADAGTPSRVGHTPQGFVPRTVRAFSSRAPPVSF
jgi:hypothetical protein